MEALREIGWTIIIFTTRLEVDKIRSYLMANGIPFDHINYNPDNFALDCHPNKVIASVYIDDRAIAFDGKWQGMAQRVESFKPYYSRGNKRPSLNLNIAGYWCDQISLFVEDVEKTVEKYHRKAACS